MLGANSIDAIKVTHSNDFEDIADAFANLAVSLGLLERWNSWVAASS